MNILCDIETTQVFEHVKQCSTCQIRLLEAFEILPPIIFMAFGKDFREKAMQIKNELQKQQKGV